MIVVPKDRDPTVNIVLEPIFRFKVMQLGLAYVP